MGVTQPARRPRVHLAAVSLTILTLAVLAAALVFTVLNTSRIGTARVGLSAILSAGVLMYVASGRLITSRRPDNAIGWLLGSIGRVRGSPHRRAGRRRGNRGPDPFALEPAHVSIWLSARS
jgi:hypothetical protein